jgi:hypothetical protein
MCRVLESNKRKWRESFRRRDCTLIKNALQKTVYANCPLWQKPDDWFLSGRSRVARLFSVQHTKTGKNIPNNYKMKQMVIWPYNRHNGQKILPLQDIPKISKIGIIWQHWAGNEANIHLSNQAVAKMPPPQYQPKQLVYVVTCEEVAR